MNIPGNCTCVCACLCMLDIHMTCIYQDVASSIFLAYASKQFEGNRWYFWKTATMADVAISNSSRHSENMSSTMGAFSLTIAGCVCLGLAAYRMKWGDDHGNTSQCLKDRQRQGRMSHIHMRDRRRPAGGNNV